MSDGKADRSDNMALIAQPASLCGQRMREGVSMPSAAEVRDLFVPHLMGRLDDASAELEVTSLDVVEQGRSFTLVVELTAYKQRWRVRLESERSAMAVFDGAPTHDLVRRLASEFRIRLFEWWHTKGSERQSAKQGERLD